MTSTNQDLSTDDDNAVLTEQNSAPEASAAFLDRTFQADPDFVRQLALNIVMLAHPGDQADDATVDDALARVAALIKGIAPQDEVEAMLATQMVAIHNATMQMASRLVTERHVNVAESYERSLNRLSRTFTTQIEALKRHRTKGVQKVIVQHVQVNEGGQAVVAGEVHGGGGTTERRSTS